MVKLRVDESTRLRDMVEGKEKIKLLLIGGAEPSCWATLTIKGSSEAWLVDRKADEDECVQCHVVVGV